MGVAYKIDSMGEAADSRRLEGLGESSAKICGLYKEDPFPGQVVRRQQPPEHSDCRLEHVHVLHSINSKNNEKDRASFA